MRSQHNSDDSPLQDLWPAERAKDAEALIKYLIPAVHLWQNLDLKAAKNLAENMVWLADEHRIDCPPSVRELAGAVSQRTSNAD